MSKKIALIVGMVIIVVVIFSILNKRSDDQVSSSSDIDKGDAPAWLQTLPDYSFPDIEHTENGSSYQYAEVAIANGFVDRSLAYEKENEDEYRGTIKLSFSSTEDSFVETIPKSFASHVDQLTFSKEPARIINPDPVVEFADVDGEVVITAQEVSGEDEMRQKMEDQIIDSEADKCEQLEGQEMYACLLHLISQYRESALVEEQLRDLDLTTLLGAVSNAVRSNNLKTCDHLQDPEQRATCYEYGYQILVEECNSKSDKAYRDCIREQSGQLPSMETRRLFCYHIDDLEMYNQCLGKAEMKTCDEIEDEDQRLICQLNIAKTKSTIKACEDIQDVEGRDICRAMLGIDKLDKRYCALVKDDYFNGECNLRIAMAKDDKTICEDIKHQDSKDLCYSYFGLIKQDVDQAMCDDINEVFLKQMCELVLAMKNKNTAMCESFTGEDEHTKLLCYLSMAVKHNDAQLCSYLTSDGDEELRSITKNLKDSCFAQIAINTNNIDLCNKIENAQIRAKCIEKLEKPDISQISCGDIAPAICPMDNASGNGATIHLDQGGGVNVQCTYHGLKSAGYPLRNEVFKLGKKKNGTYKQYYASGNLQMSSNHIEGRFTEFRIECDESGELTLCYFHEEGKATIDCMP